MVAQVFSPRRFKLHLDETLRCLRVLHQPPPVGSVSPTGTAEDFHRRAECALVGGRDLVGDLDRHWTPVVGIVNVDDGLGLMPRRRELKVFPLAELRTPGQRILQQCSGSGDQKRSGDARDARALVPD